VGRVENGKDEVRFWWGASRRILLFEKSLHHSFNLFKDDIYSEKKM